MFLKITKIPIKNWSSEKPLNFKPKIYKIQTDHYRRILKSLEILKILLYFDEENWQLYSLFYTTAILHPQGLNIHQIHLILINFYFINIIILNKN